MILFVIIAPLCIWTTILLSTRWLVISRLVPLPPYVSREAVNVSVQCLSAQCRSVIGGSYGNSVLLLKNLCIDLHSGRVDLDSQQQ